MDTHEKMKMHHKRALTIISGGYQDEHEVKFLSRLVTHLYSSYKKMIKLIREIGKLQKQIAAMKEALEATACSCRKGGMMVEGVYCERCKALGLPRPW